MITPAACKPQVILGIKFVQILNGKIYFQSNQGAAALLTIIIIGAATLLMAVTATLLGIGDAEMAYTSQQGSETLALTDGCLEEALQRIRFDTNYGLGQGQIGLTMENGSCIIEVVDLGASRRRIEVRGTHGDYDKKLKAEVLLEGNVIHLEDWQERTD